MSSQDLYEKEVHALSNEEADEATEVGDLKSLPESHRDGSSSHHDGDRETGEKLAGTTPNNDMDIEAQRVSYQGLL